MSLTDPMATPQPIRNGVDFLGYLVRPDYLLVRQRIVRRLKMRLAQYKRRLVQQEREQRVYRYEAATLAELRASWAPYQAQLTWEIAAGQAPRGAGWGRVVSDPRAWEGSRRAAGAARP